MCMQITMHSVSDNPGFNKKLHYFFGLRWEWQKLRCGFDLRYNTVMQHNALWLQIRYETFHFEIPVLLQRQDQITHVLVVSVAWSSMHSLRSVRIAHLMAYRFVRCVDAPLMTSVTV